MKIDSPYPPFIKRGMKGEFTAYFQRTKSEIIEFDIPGIRTELGGGR
jgi:hypothetical protein